MFLVETARGHIFIFQTYLVKDRAGNRRKKEGV
jgi:hypothetical protein